MKNRLSRRMAALCLALATLLSCMASALPYEGREQNEASASLNAADGLTDFSSFNHEDLLSIDEAAHTVTMNFTGGDHFVVYNGLDHTVNSFVWEADVDFLDNVDIKSAALIFGFPSKESPSGFWYGANLDTTRLDNDDAFRVFGPNIDSGGRADGVDVNRTLHLKLDVHADGAFTYSYGNIDAEEKTVTGTIGSWRGGYLGILTWESGAVFSNIALEEREEQIEKPETGTVSTVDGFQYHNNIAAADLSDLRTEGGIWEARENGLYSKSENGGDVFLYSQTVGNNFVYSTDVTFLENQGAAALLFRNADENGHAESYAANFDAGSKTGKFWRWQDGMDNQLSGQIKLAGDTSGDTYTLTVVAIDNWISYYINGELIGSTGDYYKLGTADLGQNTFIREGTFGLLNWNGEMIFQNTVFTPISDSFTPLLSDITVTSSTGTVEEKGQFVSTEPITIQYVKNNASTVDIAASAFSAGAEIRVYGPDGTEYTDGKNIPVSVGANYIAVTSTVTDENGTDATVTYRVNVHRRQADAIYYNEPYRDQYHYSVKDGWANDPNGLVCYNGTWHFFYQFYDDIRWGPMHWAHVVSKDLIHWEERPVAFYPDANGAMFSGCIVADETNTSGLFDNNDGGLVALITANGNGQRIKLAYSEDEGETWTKVDDIAADWTNDPLYNRDFRDPKVFRWEGKWFMVVAGGPLRIYSSDNLREWTCESTYANLHTECPDLYPLRASDDAVKWVLSRGGRTYKVGDFKQVGGKWRFVPDADYANEPDNGIMNFGKDSYAAMTYYIQDFGTAENPTLPDIIEQNWMNTWDNYCNQVAEKTGQAFNGTFNLNLKLGLVKDGNKYVLTQTPIEAYESLRGAPVVSLTGAEITENNSLLDNFAGDTYEIVSRFYPGTAKQVGFDLRTGFNEKTAVRYDLDNNSVSIDRGQSGILISNRFAQVDSQTVSRNADGSIDLHIYVDRASVEVFTGGYTAAGGNQIFPSVSSLGAAVVAEGGTATADVTIYPLSTVWEDKIVTETPIAMTSGNADEIKINVGDELNLQVTLLPVGIAQNVDWSISDSGVLSGTGRGTMYQAIALKAGTTVVTATAADNAELKVSFNITVLEKSFDSNIPEFTINSGNWFVNGDTLSVSNTGANDAYLSAEPVSLSEFTLETNIKYTTGLINIFFAAGGTDPAQAYAVQFGDSETFRLFRFYGDDITAPADMGKKINDGEYHNIRITKTSDRVIVLVDYAEYLNYQFPSTDSYFNENTYVGLGLWDGALDVKTFRLSENAGLTDFSSFNHADKITINETAHTVMLDYAEGDHFVVYNDLDQPLRAFTWEADVNFPSDVDTKSAALIFGFPSKDAPGSGWYGANLDSTRLGQENAFRLFGPDFDTNAGGSADGIYLDRTLHLKVDMRSNGAFTYSFGNVDAEAKTITGTIPSWNEGGYLGILTWNSAALFSNITLTADSPSPTPTSAPVPTSTPTPTSTPRPTSTPVPTATPTPGSGSTSQGCYVATSVYGSYDCPEVWTLRRFRDDVLAQTWYGRLFIRAYYAVSPTAVRLFGDADWFQTFWRNRLDKMVSSLQNEGFASTPYHDLNW